MKRWMKNYNTRTFKCPVCGGINLFSGTNSAKRQSGHIKDITCGMCGNNIKAVELNEYGVCTSDFKYQ